MRRGRFLFLEPFFGGSHRDFAEGLIEHSRHQIELKTLPARFWKWRLRGAALYLAGQLPSPRGYHGLITTNLLSLSDLRGLWGPVCPPALVYFHENQLTYPLAPGERMDYQFGFTDITTALAADRVLFNSRSHFEAFFAELPGFLRHMPEYRPRWVIEAIRGRSAVLTPGCRFAASDPIPLPGFGRPPLVIWNHRWEFDKNPDDFFAALEEAESRGARFELALLGENYQKVPKAFLRARERWGERILQYGYVEDRAEYRRWLERGALVVSTARQENFGIAVVEAIRRGCLPLLPARLSYPEILPPSFHPDFLYGTQAELVERLVGLLAELQAPGGAWGGKLEALARGMNRHAWENRVGEYDAELDRLAGFTG